MAKPTRPDRLAQYENPTYRELRALLGRNLRALRAAKGWTLEETADRCGMVVQTYHPIELGRANVTLVTLARLCDGLAVKPSELWGERRPEPDDQAPEKK